MVRFLPLVVDRVGHGLVPCSAKTLIFRESIPTKDFRESDLLDSPASAISGQIVPTSVFLELGRLLIYPEMVCLGASTFNIWACIGAESATLMQTSELSRKVSTSSQASSAS